MAKTLVTGGTGFIGSARRAALAKRGDDLRLTVRPGSRLEHLEDLDYERVDGDVLDRAAIRGAMKGVDRVFHCGRRLVGPAREDADRLFDVNVDGTSSVLEEALRAGVERVVYTSSVAAIGPAAGAGPDRRRAPALHRRRASASRTSTPSTRPRSRRCASPRGGCRWSW